MGVNTVVVKRRVFIITTNRLLLLHQRPSSSLLQQLECILFGASTAVVPSSKRFRFFSAFFPHGKFKTTPDTEKSISLVQQVSSSPSTLLSSSSSSTIVSLSCVKNNCLSITSTTRDTKKTEEGRRRSIYAGNTRRRPMTDYLADLASSSSCHHRQAHISDQSVTFRCVTTFRGINVRVWVDTRNYCSLARVPFINTTCPIRTLFISTFHASNNNNTSQTPDIEVAMEMDGNIQDMRKQYRDDSDTFDIEDLVSRDPISQFGSWFQEACKQPDIKEPNAIALATASRSGQPSVRMVLLKAFGKEGFKIFTNVDSRKGKELMENPLCSVCIHWEPLNRSVRIEGKVSRLSEEENTDYFNARPRSSRLGAIVSNQSTVIPSREYLVNKFSELEKKYENEKVIPKPDCWGGYLIKPNVIEFWQGQTTRVHDRLRFRKKEPNEVLDPELTHEGEDGWVIERLSP